MAANDSAGSVRREEAAVATAVRIGELGRDMSYVKDAVDRIDDKVSKGYVTKEEFEPIRRLVYYVASLVVLAVVGALLALIIKGGNL